MTTTKKLTTNIPADAKLAGLSLHQLVRWHLVHYSALGVQDVYKMFYQAAFGPKHLLADPEGALRSLQREFEQLSPAIGEPLVEPLAPDWSVVRLNLRPYKARCPSIHPLWEAIVETARSMVDNPELLHSLWSEFRAAVRAGELPFSEADVEVLDELIRQHGPVPLHHSEQYRRAHKPAYRVLTRRALEHGLSLELKGAWEAFPASD
ncbi:MAG: hypothetical protein ONB30_04040 [candidate division KSB1 bacterium]|nr:hypothetical protein [candidate division KSB1 bacterium]